jgi:hypothetical protein
MKPSINLLIIIFVFTLNAPCQKHSTDFQIAFSYYLPAYTSTFGENHSKGLGAEIMVDHFVSNHFSISGVSGFVHFNGYITTFNREDINYNSIPFFLGCKYHLNKLFLGIETGPLISMNKSVSTHNTFSPLLGLQMKKIQAELGLLNILGMASIPENSFLTRGGYGLYYFKISYHLPEINKERKS